jgi:hypothetical protein
MLDGILADGRGRTAGRVVTPEIVEDVHRGTPFEFSIGT